MHFARVERVPERAQHVFLTHHFGESLGAPFAREDYIAHEGKFSPCVKG